MFDFLNSIFTAIVTAFASIALFLSPMFGVSPALDAVTPNNISKYADSTPVAIPSKPETEANFVEIEEKKETIANIKNADERTENSPVENKVSEPKQSREKLPSTTQDLEKLATELSFAKDKLDEMLTNQIFASVTTPVFIPDTEKTNKLTREALVNIMCTIKDNASTRRVSGSGIIIDPRGIILTNAHIGQYFLLEDSSYADSIDCVIRTGSPASAKYDAQVLYVSPLWVKENYDVITKENPKGTGENDFALLFMNEMLDANKQAPDTFANVSYNTDMTTVVKDTQIIIAGYPSGFLGGSTILKNLWQSSTITNIEEVYTFSSGAIDILSVGGNILAQKGASGGGVVDVSTDKLIGVVVTSTVDGDTDSRTLNAITVAHISRSLLSDAGVTLEQFLNTSLSEQVKSFKESTFSELRDILLTQTP